MYEDRLEYSHKQTLLALDQSFMGRSKEKESNVFVFVVCHNLSLCYLNQLT